jgi:hypothetical protein
VPKKSYFAEWDSGQQVKRWRADGRGPITAIQGAVLNVAEECGILVFGRRSFRLCAVRLRFGDEFSIAGVVG